MNPSPSRPLPPSSGRPIAWVWLGTLFGLVSAVAIWLWAPIGVSTTYPRLIGALLRRVAPGYAAGNPMLVQLGSVVTPETFLVMGLLIGGFLASRITRTQRPPLAAVHGGKEHPRQRYVQAFLGGFLILFGARMAGGCTSGHIISGIIQLSMSGFVFAFGVFAAGILTAKTLARRRTL